MQQRRSQLLWALMGVMLVSTGSALANIEPPSDRGGE
jgi:hypothetical protein